MNAAAHLSRIAFDEYRALPALNISALKELRHSPKVFKYRLENPKTSAAMTLGTAAHCATLEPERFAQDFSIWSRRTASGDMAPRRGKEWDAFTADNAGKSIITEDECNTALAIAAAVRGDPVAAKYLEEGEPEVTLNWERDGRPCKGRLDWLTKIDGEPVLVGLKTTRDCSPAPFASSAARLGYPLQWHWYADGYKRIAGRDARTVEIVVDVNAPHTVIVYAIPEDVLGYGAAECDRLLQILERCEREDRWPGPAETELMFTLPAWAWKDDDAVESDGSEALDWEGA